MGHLSFFCYLLFDYRDVWVFTHLNVFQRKYGGSIAEHQLLGAGVGESHWGVRCVAVDLQGDVGRFAGVLALSVDQEDIHLGHAPIAGIHLEAELER